MIFAVCFREDRCGDRYPLEEFSKATYAAIVRICLKLNSFNL